MATKQVCDVYGIAKDVQKYMVRVQRLNPDSTAAEEVRNISVDLCPRALKRLVAFLERATVPPSRKKSV